MVAGDGFNCGQGMAIGRQEWLAAAAAAMRGGGIEAVRVEPLARALGVTKGSFYWHFRDRAELLEAVLGAWEEETRWLVGEAGQAGSPRERLLAWFRLVEENRGYPPDVEVLAWARRDAAVAERVERTEQLRVEFFASQLSAAGLPAAEAARRAEAAYLATQGWIERARRSRDHGLLQDFVAHVFDLVLPAEGPAAAETRKVAARRRKS